MLLKGYMCQTESLCPLNTVLLHCAQCARNVGNGHFGRLDFNLRKHFSEIKIILPFDLKLDEWRYRTTYHSVAVS